MIAYLSHAAMDALLLQVLEPVEYGSGGDGRDDDMEDRSSIVSLDSDSASGPFCWSVPLPLIGTRSMKTQLL
jgi:hypothetical protein